MAVKYREFKFHSHADKLEIHAMTVAPEGRSSVWCRFCMECVNTRNGIMIL